jgi:hypothetical protein
MMDDTGRYRELPSWRKAFKQIWKKAAKTPITMPQNEKYRPNSRKWVCTCPHFSTSRFLVCKHLVQSVHPVPAIFFLEVKRNRNSPFWEHTQLVPLDEPEIDGTKNDSMSAKSQGDSEDPDESESGGDGDSGDESDNEIIDLEQEMVGSKTFAERMTEHIWG